MLSPGGIIFAVKVSTCNPMLAKYLTEQYGDADGELATALEILKDDRNQKKIF
nr:manganese catalase family protein [Lysinibacillus sphaericus]